MTFIDSTGVGALIDIPAAVTAAGVSLHIRDAPPWVTKILQITGLASMFHVENGSRAQLTARDDVA